MILQTDISIELALAFVSALFSVGISGAVTMFVWYFRKYILSEIERNSEFRQYAGGIDSYEEDGGKLESLAELSDEMREQHRDTNHRLDLLVSYVHSMGDALRESGIEFEEPDPNDPLRGDFYRGGDDPQPAPDGGEEIGPEPMEVDPSDG